MYQKVQRNMYMDLGEKHPHNKLKLIIFMKSGKLASLLCSAEKFPSSVANASSCSGGTPLRFSNCHKSEGSQFISEMKPLYGILLDELSAHQV